MNKPDFSKFEFVVGQSYENGLGIFQVKEVDQTNGTILVCYTTTKSPYVNKYTTYKYSAKTQAECIYDIQHEKMAPTLKRVSKRVKKVNISDKESFTLGWLAQHGRIYVEVGPNPNNLFEDFKNICGKDIRTFTENGFNENASYNKYSYSMSISFKPDYDIMSRLDLPKEIVLNNDIASIYSNDYIWFLFNKGFLPGKNDINKDRIASKVSEVEQFNEGFNY